MDVVKKAHRGQLFAVGMVDFLSSFMTFVCVIAALKRTGFIPPAWVSAILGGAVFLYTLLGQRGLVFSIGAWGLGLKSHIDAALQSRVYVVRELPKSALSRRAVLIGAYVGSLFLIVSMLYPD